jgi:hypothetical protein
MHACMRNRPQLKCTPHHNHACACLHNCNAEQLFAGALHVVDQPHRKDSGLTCATARSRLLSPLQLLRVCHGQSCCCQEETHYAARCAHGCVASPLRQIEPWCLLYSTDRSARDSDDTDSRHQHKMDNHEANVILAVSVDCCRDDARGFIRNDSV